MLNKPKKTVKKPRRLWTILSYLTLPLILTTLIYLTSLLPTTNQPLELGPFETIHGIPYFSPDITEELTHADVYLNQPAFGQKVSLTITYQPININRLAIGLRENDFWLSYTWHDLPIQTQSGNNSITTTLTLPITDTFQDTDQSLDLMFYATSDKVTELTHSNQTPHWRLLNMQVKKSWDIPTWPQTKQYIRSILKRERAQ